jgi:aspartate kinase
MSLFVQKFGGTSVGTPERIRAVAERVARTAAEGHEVVVVVSAMSGETNRLLALGQQMAARPDPREMDSLVATGEQVSAALLSIALRELGRPALSLAGHQTRISTDGVFTKARIAAIDCTLMRQAISQGKIPVMAGFQGLDAEGNITTLGRGGTDTTAVAIAASIPADVCEIYTDVDGVYTADPNVCPQARKIAQIGFEEMLELASAGAKVLQLRSVEVAMKYGIPIHVRSSFSDNPGTMVGGAVPEQLESVVVAGVVSDKDEVKVTIRALPDQPGIVAKIFGALAEANISVDMIVQSESLGGKTDLTFTVTRTDKDQTGDVARAVAAKVGAGAVALDDTVAKISIVGAGMRSHAGVAAKMFRLLADHEINIQAISTSEIRVSCLVEQARVDDAVRTLHEGFGLAALGKPGRAT